MQLYITENSQLKEIQEGFNSIYPNLWLDFFYRSPNGPGQVKQLKANPETLIQSLSPVKGVQTIDISSTRQISALEHDLRNRLTIEVRILRKSANVWVETMYTGNWTLENQNFEGGQIAM